MNPLVGEFIARCFHARTITHIQHLKTRSYAAHKALNEFYDGIIPLADSFAEAYQGEYELIGEYPDEYEYIDDPLTFLKGFVDWIDENRDDISDDSYLQNIIDEIVELTRSTQYKLKFLK